MSFLEKKKQLLPDKKIIPPLTILFVYIYRSITALQRLGWSHPPPLHVVLVGEIPDELFFALVPRIYYQLRHVH